MASRPYQVQREQLTDREWSNMCRLFELAERLAVRIEERKGQSKGGHHG